MKNLKLHNFKGRFGNNMICVFNAIKWAMNNNYYKIFCIHDKIFGNDKIINNVFEIKECDISDTNSDENNELVMWATAFWNDKKIKKIHLQK